MSVLPRRSRLFLAATLLLGLLPAIAVLMPSSAAAGEMTTFAGGPGQGLPTNVAQTPRALAVQGDKIFVFDVHRYMSSNAVRVIDTSTNPNHETVVADGLALAYSFDFKAGFAVDTFGSVFVSEDGYSTRPNEIFPRVRKIDSSGASTTYAGYTAGTECLPSAISSCPATSVKLFNPSALTLDAAGNLYVADSNSNPYMKVVRKIDPEGDMTTFADFTNLDDPVGLAVSGTEVFVAAGSAVYKVNALGSPILYAGTPRVSLYGGDGGPAALAQMKNPRGLDVDAAGNLYIADRGDHRVRRVDTSGIITTFAGDGTASLAGLNAPSAVAVAGQDLYIADTGNFRVRKHTAGSTTATTVAGTERPDSGGDGGPATWAQVDPSGVVFGDAGSVYLSDPEGHRVRKIDSGGTITAYAGDGTEGYSGDCGPGVPTCPATASKLSSPAGLAFDAGDLYVADKAGMVRKIDASGAITTVAGSATQGFSGDGDLAKAATLSSPSDVAIGPDGSLYIADFGNNRVRRVDKSSGVISTWAGTGVGGSDGDGGPADQAKLKGPSGLAFDADGNLYIADAGNNRVRRVDNSSRISTWAGTGTPGSSGDGGPATAAKLTYPSELAVDLGGNLFIADSTGLVRRVAKDDGFITTYAGCGGCAFSADAGPATSSSLFQVSDVAVDANGVLLIADRGNDRVRRVATAEAPSVQLSVVAGFGEHLVGMASAPATAVVANVGSGPLHVTSASIVGDHPADFEITSDGCGATAVAPGESCAIEVRFIPSGPGPRRATIRIIDDATGSPHLLPLSGIGLLPVLAPTSGPTFGGTKVVITGLGLDRATAVRFGDSPAFSFRVDSPAQLTVVSPPHTRGVVEVVVAGASPAKTLVKTTFAYVHGSWSPTAPLNAGRSLHTATVLPNGKVLVAGGSSCSLCGGHALASAELYDPATGSWAAASSMREARSGHTATLLSDGKVLVAGGSAEIVGSAARASAEIYDPATDSWAFTGRLLAARSKHTATRLADGTVLVAGGTCRGGDPSLDTSNPTEPTDCVSGGALASAEVFQPGAGVWTSVTPMDKPHVSHTATLLGNGKVLVAGGYENAASPYAELYDPESRRWQLTAPLDSCAPLSPSCEARQSHTATMLPSGKVLVAGGYKGSKFDDPEYGLNSGLSSAQIYDPAGGVDGKGSWAPAPSMSAGRSFHVATLISGTRCESNCGKVLVGGGTGECTAFYSNSNGCLSARFLESTELYDPVFNRWTAAGAMTAPRSHSRVVVLSDGNVLVAGGARDPGVTREADKSVTDVDVYRPGGAQPPVTIVKLHPPAANTLGTTRVTISGSGLFSYSTAVKFGELDAPISFLSDTELTTDAPVQAQGEVRLTVRTPLGQASSDFIFGAGNWTPTSSLTRPRSLVQAFMLDGPSCRLGRSSCGKVLVGQGLPAPPRQSGGFGPPELYEPRTGVWGRASQVITPGGDFDATPALIVDGPACRTEGTTPPGFCGSLLMYGYARSGDDRVLRTFLWNPDTGLVSGASDTRTLRFEPTFSLLDGPPCHGVAPPSYCGKILLAGGNTSLRGKQGLVSAELYDPADPGDPGWVATGDMNDGRSVHTAIVLESGEVLVAGGVGNHPTQDSNRIVLSSAELYRPQTGTWIRTGSLAVARTSHTATLLDRHPCGANCGKVLVVGGANGAGRSSEFLFTDSAETYDRRSETWSPAGILREVRAGHSSTMLSNGNVLVAGRSPNTDLGGARPVSSAEVYDPITNDWTFTSSMASARGAHAAALLDGPACRGPSSPEYCGRVLVAGGSLSGELADKDPMALQDPTAQTELYIPAPSVHALLPAGGPEGTQVVITGANFAPGDTVSFDGVPLPADAVSFDSPTQLTVVSPAHRPGRVEVAVAGDGGTSAHLRPLAKHLFTYSASAVPAQVADLVATALSETEVELSFPAPADDSRFPTEGPPAERFVIKQSTERIVDDAAFDTAVSLCGGECTQFVPGAIGAPLSLRVTDLEPGTTYYFALRAVNDIGAGPASKPAWVTTFGQLRAVCQAVEAAAGQVLYGGGRYHLVGGPDGTAVGSDSPLYSWFDQGTGGSYATGAGNDPLSAGRGYWSYSRCDRAVSPAGAGADQASFDLGAYHASMVANPSGTAPATLTGHDFSARWDPSLNGGAGGYHISAYREPQSLAVGEGIWAFSFVPAKLSIQT